MKRILYVEDEPIISYYAQIFRKACNEAFHGEIEIVECGSMEEELAILQNEKFDALIQDLTLKDSSQARTEEKLADFVDKLPVLVLTGDDSIYVRNRCLALGSHGVIDFSLKDDAIKCPKMIMERIYNMIVIHSAKNSLNES